MAKYKCWIPIYGQTSDDGQFVEAFDAAAAAAKFVERYEARNSEHPVANGDTLEIAVDVGRKEPEIYAVWGEACPIYYARKKEG